MVQRKDLASVEDRDWPQRQKEYMKCQDCGASMGGTRGDYYSVPMEHIFKCASCGSQNVKIVVDVTTQKIIKS